MIVTAEELLRAIHSLPSIGARTPPTLTVAIYKQTAEWFAKPDGPFPEVQRLNFKQVRHDGRNVWALEI